MSHTVDLRSDTVTLPTPAMRQAMMEAPVGDDVYGEDPSINALESKVAKLLGKEAALFVPSGTMANQLAIQLHTQHGDTVIGEQDTHVYLYEGGAAAALSGIQFDLIPLAKGISPAAVEELYRADGLHASPTTLLVVENTHNRGLGRVLDVNALQAIWQTATKLGLKTHCDGARLWNAAAALQESEANLVAGFDSVAVCFSKGLGAPVGSALCGNASFIARARKKRKMWGGGMRQAGFLAAAASYALDHHRSRLTTDHAHVWRLKEGLESLGGRAWSVEVPTPHTNMLYLNFGSVPAAEAAAKALAAQGVLLSNVGRGRLRAVVHLHIDGEKVDQAIQQIGRLT